ncbi:unnamed protein product [Linum trigynum]|uniref:Uncharacterized protein n=1 Tax=Linum trigynum TaxID=586398 RepID=A0AAV2CW82_9ROSI
MLSEATSFKSPITAQGMVFSSAKCLKLCHSWSLTAIRWLACGELLLGWGEGKGLGLPIAIGPYKGTRAVEKFHIAEPKGSTYVRARKPVNQSITLSRSTEPALRKQFVKRSCDMKTLIAIWGKFPSGNNGFPLLLLPHSGKEELLTLTTLCYLASGGLEDKPNKRRPKVPPA